MIWSIAGKEWMGLDLKLSGHQTVFLSTNLPIRTHELVQGYEQL